MDSIGNRGLEKLLSHHSEYDYVAFVMTAWHAHAFEAALKLVENDTETNLKGIVVYKPHPQSGYCIEEKRFSHLNCDCYRFVEDESIMHRVKSELQGAFYYARLKANNRSKFYFFKPNGFRYPILAMFNRAFSDTRKVVYVSLDEGVGIYLDSNTNWFHMSLKENKTLIGKIKTFVKYYEMRLFDTTKIEKTDQYINGEMLIKKGDEYIANGRIVDYFRESFREYGINNNVNGIVNQEKYIIVNTQPNVLINEKPSDERDEIIRRFVYEAKDLGYCVLIKPHPREKDLDRYAKLGAEIIDDYSVSQEVFFAMTSCFPRFLVGFYSTTLITAKLLFGISTISLNHFLLESEHIDETTKDIIEKFMDVFGNWVIMPSTIEEIKELL